MFLDEARALGLDTGRAIGVGMLPIMVGASTRATKVVTRMYERGINTSLIISRGIDARRPVALLPQGRHHAAGD